MSERDIAALREAFCELYSRQCELMRKKVNVKITDAKHPQFGKSGIVDGVLSDGELTIKPNDPILSGSVWFAAKLEQITETKEEGHT